MDASHDPLLAPAIGDAALAWRSRLDLAAGPLAKVVTSSELDRYCQRVLESIRLLLKDSGPDGFKGEAGRTLRETLAEVSESFAERGLAPSDTATFVFALRESLNEQYRKQLAGDDLARKMDEVSLLVDRLGLFTFEAYVARRERIIKSQAEAITELATPVIQVWDGIVALPLVGAIDSIRAKDIMERLLTAVMDHSADIVIIDITGVPVVDTQVASRLMRTVEAVSLLGTRSIITGINPVIAQTMVQLGVDLSQLTTRATLRAGLKQAFRELGLTVLSPNGTPAGKR